MKIDYTLYLVTDRMLMSTSTLCEAVEQAVLGGCTMVQLREKSISAISFYHLAKEIKQITYKHSVPLIINDRLDIALSVEAEGVHIGQSDIPASAARKIIGGDMLLGVSAASLPEAIRAQNEGADYLGVGAMFPTGTKNDAVAVSMNELQSIQRAVTIPIVAIGGINRENAYQLAHIGIDGLAVVSAILSQPDITKAAKELRNIFCGEGRA